MYKSSAISPIWSHFTFVNHWKSTTFRSAKRSLKIYIKIKLYGNLEPEGKKDAVPAPFGTLFFAVFWRFRRFQTVINDLSCQVSTWKRVLRRKVTALRQPTKYRFATCCGMAQQPSTDDHLGIPRNSYQVPWFGCLHKSVLDCFVKSFPNVGPYGTNERERT